MWDKTAACLKLKVRTKNPLTFTYGCKAVYFEQKPSKAIPNLLACRGKVFYSSRHVEVCCPLLCRVSRSAPTSPHAHELPKATSNSTAAESGDTPHPFYVRKIFSCPSPWVSSLSEKIPEELYYTFWTI